MAGSARHLTRAIRNVLDNADRHATSMVTVTTTSSDGRVTIHIDDDGAGIEPAARSIVFDRFTRLDEERTRGHDGAGLGLAISREIVHGHGGSIECDEAPRGGARFTISLPAIEAARPAPPDGPPPQTVTSAPATHVGEGASAGTACAAQTVPSMFSGAAEELRGWRAPGNQCDRERVVHWLVTDPRLWIVKTECVKLRRNWQRIVLHGFPAGPMPLALSIVLFVLALTNSSVLVAGFGVAMLAVAGLSFSGAGVGGARPTSSAP